MKRTDTLSHALRRAALPVAAMAMLASLTGCGPLSSGYVSVGDDGYYGPGYVSSSITSGYWPYSGYWGGGTYWPGSYWPGNYWPGNSIPVTRPNPRPPMLRPGGGPNVPSAGRPGVSTPVPLPSSTPVGGGAMDNVAGPNVPGR